MEEHVQEHDAHAITQACVQFTHTNTHAEHVFRPWRTFPVPYQCLAILPNKALVLEGGDIINLVSQ